MGHYSAKPLRIEDLERLRPERMLSFYDARFANADDFTFFIVGAFDVARITPLVAQYFGGLPSNSAPPSTIGDMRLQFPPKIVREVVKKGQEPQSRTVLSFFADTGLDEMEMHRLRAACSVLETRLRDLLREELGGTYGVGVSYTNNQPQTGYGTVVISFGSAPENADTLVAAVLKAIDRLRAEGPTADEIQKIKEIERRDLETSARTNAYWMNSLQTVHLLGWDPLSIARRPQRTDSLTVENVHAPFKKYFPSDRYTVVTLLPEK
jgi:zinc protease